MLVLHLTTIIDGYNLISIRRERRRNRPPKLQGVKPGNKSRLASLIGFSCNPSL
jgi:hypothetical protein